MRDDMGAPTLDADLPPEVAHVWVSTDLRHGAPFQPTFDNGTPAHPRAGDTLEPLTKARYASTLSKVLEHAKRTGWLRANPAADARRPRVPSRRPRAPATVEVREALRIAKSEYFPLYAYVIGMATIGCRRSELLAITIIGFRGPTLVWVEA